MPKKLTKEAFIQKAIAIHGDKYDYSLVDYVNNSTKVKIICPMHGEFLQTPHKHMMGRGCPDMDCINERRKNTTLSHYGVDNPAKADEVKKKMADTNIKRYGVDNPMKNADIVDRLYDTNMKRYGVKSTFELDDVKEKSKITRIQRYGGNSPMCSEEVRKKHNETMKRLYGVEYALQSPLFRDKALNTLLQNYGVENPMESEEIKSKAAATSFNRYGVDSVLSHGIIRDKINALFLEKYGSLSPLSFNEVRKKSVSTWFNIYGVDNPARDDKIKQKIQDTNIIRYGVTNPMHVSSIKNKVTETKRSNGTFNTSVSEDIMYDVLCGIFGEDDVKRQYSDDRYPFACDFYIKSRDMFVELNASWTHGKHWYDELNKDDISIVKSWKDKNTDYYKNAVYCWTDLDVRKRNIAKNNGLNYVVFWDNNLADVEIWCDFGCPDGKDWYEMYSWSK